MRIKVQIEDMITEASVKQIPTKDLLTETKKPLTFIAYSDTVKAHVLESFVRAKRRIGISVYEGPMDKEGEWHEDFAKNAIFNK